MNIRTLLFVLLIIVSAWSCSHQEPNSFEPAQRATEAPGFVYLKNGEFWLNDSLWFPLMVNYKLHFHAPGTQSFYDDTIKIKHDIESIAAIGFNTIRICMDKPNSGCYFDSRKYNNHLEEDSLIIFPEIEKMVHYAEQNGLKLMLLIPAPFNEELAQFDGALMRHFATINTIFAYDLMNEPLYFDPVEKRTKADAFQLVSRWRDLVDSCAPNQLFTIGFSEPIEVFEWDASILPVDFVQIHTYHPLRVACEMYWIEHYVGKPWMIGETSLPADNVQITYQNQSDFMERTFLKAREMGAIGFGWWEYTDRPIGVNFEAQYSGIVDTNGKQKPVALKVKQLEQLTHTSQFQSHKGTAKKPINFFNILGYQNILLKGKIIDKATKKPIEGAVVRGWNRDWSVGINSFSESNGIFRLYSNDSCVHFTISAPGYETIDYLFIDNYPLKTTTGRKVKHTQLPNIEREYQQIDLLEFKRGRDFFNYRKKDFHHWTYQGKIGVIELRKLTLSPEK